MFPIRILICGLLGAGWVPAAEPRDEPETPAPVPLAQAVSRMTFPDEFNVTLFAGEPQVVQPISMTLDARGRVWVVESMAYPEWQRTNGPGKDRVIILEDTNGDGRADSRKVFLENGRNLTSVAVGLGGVWLCSTPNLVFVPDRNRDDRPDGPAEVVLDGWDLESKHNAFNGLTWGPGGWLYGCNGILSNSKVGRPGTPESQRTLLNCGVWRYHPTRREFEAVAHGTTNPWGLAFDGNGEMFLANCVIKHLFHIVPGGRYERMFGQDMNAHAFRLLPSCADHIHWIGGFWNTEGAHSTQNDNVGGGHAHCGAMIYLGDNWPQQYWGNFFTINVHGRRINRDRLDRTGSGFAGRHAQDVLRVNDPWFRGVSLMYGPDGAVYMSDWSDSGECHDYIDINRNNGRIYRITYGEPNAFRRDLQTLSDADLIAYQTHANDWLVSQARLILQERAKNGRIEPATVRSLKEKLLATQNTVHQLRYLWALHAAAGGSEQIPLANLEGEYARGWAIQLATEANPEFLKTVNVRKETSPLVRRFIVSALQRLPVAGRTELAAALAEREEDAGDPNIPLLLWYGIEPIAATNTAAAIKILEGTRIPVVAEFIAQRLALRNELAAVVGLIPRTSRNLPGNIATGLLAALGGQRSVARPPGWEHAETALASHANERVRWDGLRLALIFGSEQAAETLKKVVLDKTAETEKRREALLALVQAKLPGLPSVLQELLKDTALRQAAIRGLSGYDDAAAASAILAGYRSYNSEEQNEAIATLSSRPAFVLALLSAVQTARVPARDITPFAARQMLAHKDSRIDAQLTSIFGQSRAISPDKTAKIAEYRRLLTKPRLAKADLAAGRVAFNRTCGACHTLFGEGGTLAPELTGSHRSNMEYILENVVDPSAIVWNEYKTTYFETADDRVISGVVVAENEQSVTIQTQTGTMTLPRKEITTRTQSNVSIMPEGLFDTLEEQELVNLVAYLQSPTPVAPK